MANKFKAELELIVGILQDHNEEVNVLMEDNPQGEKLAEATAFFYSDLFRAWEQVAQAIKTLLVLTGDKDKETALDIIVEQMNKHSTWVDEQIGEAEVYENWNAKERHEYGAMFYNDLYQTSEYIVKELEKAGA